jgi:diguanylate cyclase (GGDEF)-like protein
MEKLQVFICENFYPEYQAALQKEGINDIELHGYPTLCNHKGKKSEAKEILSQADTGNSILICNKSCDAIKLLDGDKPVDTITGNYCFTHLTCDEFLEYLISQGSYIVSTGWLKKWRNHLAAMGFDKDTARSFFQETSKQIVFLDAKIDDNVEGLLVELSSYLGLPYLILPVKLEIIRLLLKSKIFEWRVHHQNSENSRVINELRSKSADYAAVFDMLGKISLYTSKRDVIGKVKDLFIMVFGAQNFRFWSDHSELMPKEIGAHKSNHENYTMLKSENRFLINVTWDDHLFGILDASEFLFPQYIDRYLNLALDITKFIGLVLHNNEQYEKIMKSEKELTYLSFHDSLTGLYNRTYINQQLTDEVNDHKKIVFMFDIDKLKYVNDSFGHAAGNQLIQSFADVIKQCFREVDTVARIGGDEFTAVLFDGDEELAKTIQQRIRNLIKMKNENLKDKHLELSVSMGYALNESDNETLEDLMKKADSLMYEDKKSVF